MSAFGQAGFGSRNRRNQLRSQGQMDPYGQQVRAARQAPTFSVYQTQGTQQAAGQQQAQSPSQPAQQPAAAQPSLQLGAPAMPAYQQSSAQNTGEPQVRSIGFMATPDAAQPIPPQSQGTPYGADPGYAARVAASEQQWNSTPAGSQKRDWEGNTARNMLARGLPPDMAARDASGMSMDVVRASQDLEQRLRQNDDYMRQLRATDGVVLGPNQRWMQPSLQPNAPQQVYEVAGFGVGPDGKTMQPIYQPAKGKLQLRSQSTPGQAQPVQPQSQGTPYQSQPMVNDRPMRSIEDDMAADRGSGVQNAWWEAEASRRGVDPLTGAPLANRSAEQAAYHSAAYAPPDTSLPPQDEGILAYLRQRDAPKPTAQPSQQLYRTAMNSGVPDQQLAFEQDAFRNMAQRAVDREAFHGANDPYVQQFLNRMQYQGFDPRQGLSVSQHIQDAQAMRQRHAAIRANPTAYQRGEN